MKPQELVAGLCEPGAYPHPVSRVVLLETHMSWVFLTGQFAYKVKKPVRFDFVDFTDPDRRHFFCEEELRCNRAFAPELYLDIVPIQRGHDDGRVRVVVPDPQQPGAAGDQTVEWAVRMVQFDPDQQADRLLEEGRLERAELARFGGALAATHAALEPVAGSVNQIACVTDNFRTLHGCPAAAAHKAALAELERSTRADIARYDADLAARVAGGRIRECHGDLHLSNLVRTSDGIRAFDCLEFDQSLRTIDVISDVAFLFMDCAIRGRADLAYAFVDGYLDACGDYRGAALLPFWARYRSLVRAKVAALRLTQSIDADARVAAQTKLDTHVAWAVERLHRPPPTLVLTCGLSGSGKSFWAAQLVAAISAIRLRSDVLRKTQHGLEPDARSASPVGGGMYSSSRSDAVYHDLATLARSLLDAGESVIVDAAHLLADQRRILYDMAAAAGITVRVLQFEAPEVVLRERIQRRKRVGRDPSEADGRVLDWQLEHWQPPTRDEPVVTIATEDCSLADVAAAAMGRASRA